MPQLDNFIFPTESLKDEYHKSFETNLNKYLLLLRRIINNGLNFSENFNCLVTTITTNATPGVATAITHSLKRIPVGVLIAEKNKAAHIYTSAKDATTYSIKSDVASVTVTLIIF
jgi:hypothetical protein